MTSVYQLKNLQNKIALGYYKRYSNKPFWQYCSLVSFGSVKGALQNINSLKWFIPCSYVLNLILLDIHIFNNKTAFVCGFKPKTKKPHNHRDVENPTYFHFWYPTRDLHWECWWTFSGYVNHLKCIRSKMTCQQK